MIPTYQLCTDCLKVPRAIAEGRTGYGCLCVSCFEARITKARAKKKPARIAGKKKLFGYTDEEWKQLLHEAMTQDDKDLQLENLEEL